MPSHVHVISIPTPDTVVTPAVDVGTSNVGTNPAAHLVDAKERCSVSVQQLQKGDTSGKPRNCFACQSTTHEYADCQDPRKAILAKGRMALLQKRVRSAGKRRDFSRYTPKLGKHLTTQHIWSSMSKGVHRSPLKELMLPALVLRPFRSILTLHRGADIADGDDDEVALGE
jgi:hypothetical protein